MKYLASFTPISANQSRTPYFDDCTDRDDERTALKLVILFKFQAQSITENLDSNPFLTLSEQIFDIIELDQPDSVSSIKILFGNIYDPHPLLAFLRMFISD